MWIVYMVCHSNSSTVCTYYKYVDPFISDSICGFNLSLNVALSARVSDCISWIISFVVWLPAFPVSCVSYWVYKPLWRGSTFPQKRYVLYQSMNNILCRPYAIMDHRNQSAPLAEVTKLSMRFSSLFVL